MARQRVPEEIKKQKRREYQHRYYLKNKERLKQYKKEYYNSCNGEYKMRSKIHYLGRPLQLDGHSFVSPSSLHRVLICPASATMCKDIPEETSPYAEEGTAFHKLMEFNNVYYDGVDINKYFASAQKLLVNNNFSEAVLLELAENWMKTCKFVTELKQKAISNGYEVKEYKELNLPMYYNSKDSGTLDLGLVFTDKENRSMVFVIDYKYGKGVEVEAVNNPQLISYGVSFCKYLIKKNSDFKPCMVTLGIYQPRLENSFKKVKYTPKDLYEDTKFINDGVKIVYDVYENGKDLYEYSHVSEEGCRFCKAKGFCKKYNEQMTDLIGDIVEDVTVKSNLPEVQITNEEVIKIFEFEKNILPKIEDYIKMVKSSVEKRLLAGENIAGIKLVKSVTRTRWIDDKDLIIRKLQEVGVDAVDHAVSIKSIGAVKKLLKKDDEVLKELTYLPEGKPQVVLDTDERESLSMNLLGDLN